jgi:hypothetical protein
MAKWLYGERRLHAMRRLLHGIVRETDGVPVMAEVVRSARDGRGIRYRLNRRFARPIGVVSVGWLVTLSCPDAAGAIGRLGLPGRRHGRDTLLAGLPIVAAPPATAAATTAPATATLAVLVSNVADRPRLAGGFDRRRRLDMLLAFILGAVDRRAIPAAIALIR